MTSSQIKQLKDALRPFAENAPFYDGYGNVSALYGRTPRRPTGADYHRAAQAMKLLESLEADLKKEGAREPVEGPGSPNE